MQNENLQIIVALVLALLILAFLTYLAIKLTKALSASISVRPDLVMLLALSSLMIGFFGLLKPELVSEGASLSSIAIGIFSLMLSAITYKRNQGVK